MKILITGASGFIGKNVKEYLEQKNFEIYAPSSRELDCIEEKEVTSYLLLHRFDYILHFAIYIPNRENGKEINKVLDYNLRIFLNFSKNSKLYGKMFYFGSGAEYDKRFDIVNVREKEVGESIPIDGYGLMKYTISQIIEKSDNIYNFRLFGVFGKYEEYSTKFISNICCKAIKDMPLSMRQNLYFDYLWINDLCRMIECFLHKEPAYHTYNLVSGKRISLKEISDIVLKIAKKDLKTYVCKCEEGKEYTASNERFISEYPEFVYTPIEKAIEELYRWYEKNETIIDIYKLIY